MNKKWVVLLVSAGTDFVVTTGSALTAAMVAKGDAMLPSYPILILATVGGVVAFARTIQQEMKHDLDEPAAVKKE